MNITELILGFALGLIGSLFSGIVLFKLEGRREAQRERQKQRKEDVRVARNWSHDGKRASLRGFDLAGENLSGIDLSGADLEDSNFEGAKLWGTNFSGANLIFANFANSVMVGVVFKGADLQGADFSGATLRETDFTESKLRKAKLGQIRNLENCVWTDARIDETTDLTPSLLQEIRKPVLMKENPPSTMS